MGGGTELDLGTAKKRELWDGDGGDEVLAAMLSVQQRSSLHDAKQRAKGDLGLKKKKTKNTPMDNGRKVSRER